MPPKDDAPSPTHGLLRRAHSPDSAARIFADKIQHRPLLLRPSSPPSSSARDARRRARDEKRKRVAAFKPKPLSARERRRRGLYRLPDGKGKGKGQGKAEGEGEGEGKKGGEERQRYAVFQPLNALWAGYIREVLGPELYGVGGGGQGAAAKLSAADLHGAEVEVARSRCPARVGVGGIVVRDSRFALRVVTPRDRVKTLPKEGTVFRVRVPPPPSLSPAPGGDVAADDRKPFCFEIHGDQFQHRASDRASKKFKSHFLKKL
ncbi:RNase P/MRP, p29 subunit [Xylaria palmicola]|nr:RNase P/MRP, p29 subunit [Xylaria palmicola]